MQKYEKPSVLNPGVWTLLVDSLIKIHEDRILLGKNLRTCFQFGPSTVYNDRGRRGLFALQDGIEYAGLTFVIHLNMESTETRFIRRLFKCGCLHVPLPLFRMDVLQPGDMCRLIKTSHDSSSMTICCLISTVVVAHSCSC